MTCLFKFFALVSSGPNEPGRYTRWKEEATDGDTEFGRHSRRKKITFLAALLLKQSAAYLVCHACVCM